MSNSAFTPTFAQNLQDASATQKGLVNTTTQTFAGKKTFDGGAAIKGDTSGSAIAAGYVGEIKTAVKTTGDVTGPASAGTWVDITTTVSIDKGIYLAMYYVTLSSLTSLGAVVAAEIYDATNSTPVGNSRQSIQLAAGPLDGLISVFVPINVTTDGTLFKLRASANQAYSTSPIWRENLTASWTDDQRARLSFIRIA